MGRSGTAAQVALAAVALVVGPALAGCGDDDADAFKEDYNAAVKPLSEANSQVSGAIDSESDESNAAIAERFQGLAEKTQQTQDNLRELEPPEDAKEAYDELLGALKVGTDDLSAVAEAARDSDPAAARTARDSLEESAEDIQQAERALQRAVDG
jgi:chromosome segregation ATPase